MTYIESFSQEFSKLSLIHQRHIIELMRSWCQGKDPECDFVNIDYRELYFIMFSEVANVTDTLINLQQRMEGVHMNMKEMGLVIDFSASKYNEGRNDEMYTEGKIREEAYKEAFERTFDEEYARRIEAGEDPSDARENAKFAARDCAEAASAEVVNNYRLIPKD